MKSEIKALKNLIKNRKWKQGKAAEMLGINQGMISRLLHNKVAMHGSTKILVDVLTIEYKLEQLTCGDIDARHDLLRRRHELLNGDLNMTDSEIEKAYYEPFIKKVTRT